MERVNHVMSCRRGEKWNKQINRILGGKVANVHTDSAAVGCLGGEADRRAGQGGWAVWWSVDEGLFETLIKKEPTPRRLETHASALAATRPRSNGAIADALSRWTTAAAPSSSSIAARAKARRAATLSRRMPAPSYCPVFFAPWPHCAPEGGAVQAEVHEGRMARGERLGLGGNARLHENKEKHCTLGQLCLN